MENIITVECGLGSDLSEQCLLIMRVSGKPVCCNDKPCDGFVPRNNSNKTKDNSTNIEPPDS